MIAVADMEGSGLAQGLMDEQCGGFMEGLRAEVGIVSGREWT
jgi:hypothetical protein